MKIPHAAHHSDITGDEDAPAGPQLNTGEHGSMGALTVDINTTGNADTVPEDDTSSDTEGAALADDAANTSPWIPDVAILIGGDFVFRPNHKPEIETVGAAGGDDGISSTSSGGDSTWCPDATVMIRGNYRITPIRKRGKEHDVTIEPNCPDGTNASEKPPARGNSDRGGGTVINLDGLLASMKKHPFRVLVASPLMIIAATSLALFAVTAALCDVIVCPGEDTKTSAPQDEQSDGKKPSGPQGDRTSSK